MYHFINLTSFFISQLPRQSLESLARFLTFIFFRIFRLRQRLILQNLEIAFGNTKNPQEKAEIAQSSFYHFILTALELLYFRNGDIACNMTMENAEPLIQALARGEGAYVIAMHMSNWEAAASGVAKQIKPVNVVVKKVGSPGLDRFITQLRTRNGMNVIVRKSAGDAIRAMRRVLKGGEIVAVILDQARPGEPFLPFFGKPAKTNTSFTAIWARIKAPIFIAYSTRSRVGEHVLHCKSEIFLKDTGNAQQDIIDNSTHLNQVIETCIRECPQQYFWLHDRWKP